MKTFLIVVAGMFAALVLFVVVVIVALRFFVMSKLAKLRDAFEKMGTQLAAGAVPPFAMTLKSLPEGSWNNERVAELSSGLEQRGFATAGDFLATPFPVPLKLRLLAHPALGMQAAIYEHPAAGVWLDLVTRYGDGRVVCDSSCRDHLMDSMPQKSIRFHEGADTSTVYEAHVAQTSRRPLAADSPEGTAAVVRAHLPGRDGMARLARGADRGRDRARVRAGRQPGDARNRRRNPPTMAVRVPRVSGQRPARGAARWRRSGCTRMGARRESSGVRVRWPTGADRRRTCPIDPRAFRESAGRLWTRRRRDGDEDEDRYEAEQSRRATEVADRVAAVGARRAFAEITREWQGRKGFQLYRTVDDPIPADVYLLPEYDEDVAGHLE